MSDHTILTDAEIEKILCRDSECSEYEDNLENELSDEDVYDSDADPDYVPDLQSDDEVAITIKNVELNSASNQIQKNKRRKTSTQRESTEKNTGTPHVLDSPYTDHLIEHDEEIQDNERESLTVQLDEDHLVGKDGFMWDTGHSSCSGVKTCERNVVHVHPGPTNNARLASHPIECFKLFFTPDIMQEILIHTNEEIARKKVKYSRVTDGSLKEVTLDELDALFGILFLSAALKDNHLATRLMFDTSYSGSRYRATFSERRFCFLLDCLRFDQKESREERKKADKLAAISCIWNMLIVNCKKNYIASPYVTIDEQLVGFRGKCPFRMYIPSKPNKYGIKIVMMCDNNTKYMLNALPYLGKGTVKGQMSVADFFVNELVEPIIGTNRNVTMDNWFTSVPLAEKLLKEKKLTVIGTIKKNKRQLPPEFTNLKHDGRKTGSSFFLFHDKITAVSYKAKDNKMVTLISTMHSGSEVNHTTKKPEIIMAYNSTKGSVDCFDQMCQNKNCGRKTKRWPLCLFYNMLNISSINAYVVYVHNFYRNNDGNVKPLSRLEFMLQLHKELCQTWLTTRLNIPTISGELRNVIRTASGASEETNVVSATKTQQGKRKYCSFCDYKKKRMTTTYCLCGKAICGEHQIKRCPEC
jgi:hypothetical protein